MEYIQEQFRKSVREKPDAPFLYDDLHPAGVTWAEFDNLIGRVYGWLKARGIDHSCYPCNERGFTLSDESGYGAYVLYQHSIYDPVRFGNVLMKPVKVPANSSASQTFLDILIVEGDEGITLGMDYMIPVYRPESITRFAELFRRITEELCAAAARGGSGSMEGFMARIRQLL